MASLFRRNIVPNVKDAKREISETYPNIPCGLSLQSIRLLLHRCGYSYKKLGRRQQLKLTNRLVKMRDEYLERIKEVREERGIVYTDETWVDTYMIKERGFISKCEEKQERQTMNLPQGSRGKRIIVVHAGSGDGFLPGAFKIATKCLKLASQDYHQDMDSDKFLEYAKNALIPAIKRREEQTGRPQALVFDNAPYHGKRLVKVPNSNSKKQEMLDFLRGYGVPLELRETKKTLYEKVSANLSAANSTCVRFSFIFPLSTYCSLKYL